MELTYSYVIRWIFIVICVQLRATSLTYADDGIERGVSLSKLITKVQLTQKGYIQFLRYTENVPFLTEYTFCIWMKSYNLTYSHPILSYSKHEEERLIRVWISPHGKAINLEIHGIPVFRIPTKFKEHQWYHICQSWSSETGSWEVFVNKMKFHGHVPKLSGIGIKEGGDIVIGQEYTDFDKGLDDGIEGDIFGFNFVLSSTSSRLPKTIYKPSMKHYVSPTRIIRVPKFESGFIPMKNKNNRRLPRIIVDESNSSPKTKLIKKRENKSYGRGGHHSSSSFRHHPPRARRMRSVMHKSLGMKLVELSRNCALGKGAPLHGEKVLISWIKTTVRVFGGAIVKHVKPFC
ncbi:hypothetical protein HHI36_006120 [Cryptolaemus montrouzieri]|uniref:Pentraxin (PTX) domain-containing protein n=1 Tax=Cryptolaemus montrouzieri TaxID=559131 RepID=A0ABD2NWL1_9CUCU